ncbi:MAG TPA: beta-ketoacyl-ACP synthase II [Armatimonadota bacterium]|jgi:3-oxoacyl-[acyl-carrier-protein] synthase II
MSTSRVVVTGVGAVTPVGIGVETTWQSVLHGVSGAAPITAFDPEGYNSRFACEVKGFEPSDYMERRVAKHLDRFSQFALAAAKMAVSDAGLEITESLAPDVGVVIGSGIGGMATWEAQHTNLLTKGPNRVSPYLIPMMISDMAAGAVSIELGACGPNMSVVTACASSGNAIGEASEMIRRGAAKAIVTGGAEATITPISVAGFASMKALSFRNDDPATASRPFDRTRDGFVMGEGSAILVLEDYEFAKARGAKIYGEILGYGATGDAYHITSPEPSGRGAAAAMVRALTQAGLTTEQIGYINAHGTSTPANDRLETIAVKRVFGDAAYRVPISSTKSLTGHMLGAAGAVELIFCLLAMRDNIIPATWHYSEPDPDCDLDYVPNVPREAVITTAMSNSFGFGGHNASLIVGKI